MILVIRSKWFPFFWSHPSGELLVISSLTAALAMLLPFTPLGTVFSFVGFPGGNYLVLLLFMVAHMSLAEGRSARTTPLLQELPQDDGLVMLGVVVRIQ